MTETEFEIQITALTQEMYRVACSLLRNEHDRQDAVQECIWKAWKNLPRLRNEAVFRPWLMRILINECKSVWRKKRRETVADPPESGAHASDDLDDRLRDAALQDAVMLLPEAMRLTVTLYYMDGFSLKETALALRVPVGTVKSRLHQAKARLRALLEREV